ncbi:MAG: polysaccharide ABC transporter ATP-binding protein [Candidatus Omnitrophica bacterium]|nr:polysaccharide ABC transporter ATP-binding protein [Candidatus Omnitrophota bacterium]
MNTVIKIENLGKKYMLHHEHYERRYTALRDVIMDTVKETGKRFFKRGAVKTKDSTVEEFWALKGISLDICQGDRVGVIGRNGAGKSTLLKILSRITDPSEGKISSKGRVASLLEVGTGFHPELTGSENIYLNGAILGMNRGEIKKKFDEIVAFAEVERFLDTPVKRYSSGMYLRLAFAVAAHLESEILMIDEVLSVGDVVFQKKCLGKMGDLTKEGRTLLFVSHNIPTLRALCSRAILLDRGKLLASGETAAIISQYLSDRHETANAAVEFIPRPGANVFFTRAWITDDQGDLSTDVDVLKPFMIGLEFQVLILTTNTEITVVLENSLGVKVLFTSLSDGNNKEFVELKPGLYKTSVWLKENFLVPDVYSVRIAAHYPGTLNIDTRENVLRFNVVETGSTMLRYGQTAINWCCVLGGTKWDIHKK